MWDLDNTLWEGVCLEGPVAVKPEVTAALETLDRRGILHSIASRGDRDLSVRTLKQHGLDDFFLVPQINWLPKTQSILRISRELGLSLDAIAFIDDDAFEREQVKFMLPEVLTIPADQAPSLPGFAEFTAGEITDEAGNRRRFYRAEMDRHEAETSFSSREEFLRSCAMKLTVRPMKEDDLPRVLELMTRTHQLNTTGKTFDREEIGALMHAGGNSPRVFVAELRDKFGSYGTIGVAMIDCAPDRWRLTYFALSCRVMGRGIERAFLSTLVRTTCGTEYSNISAEFRDTGRNKMMRTMYQMMGFSPSESSEEDGSILFHADARSIPAIPPWVEIA